MLREGGEAIDESCTVRRDGGVAFEDGPDRGRVLVFGHETGGAYSMMEYCVAPRATAGLAEAADFGPHRHRDIEETFVVRRGALNFLLGKEVLALEAGDLVRVPPGVRHGFVNVSGRETELLVSFHPGGFEELFVTHRSDQSFPPTPTGFMDDAVRRFAPEFEA